MDNDINTFYGCLIRGELREAVNSLKQHSLWERYDKYIARFEQGRTGISEIPTALRPLLEIYYAYYRNVFWRKMDSNLALEEMAKDFAALFGQTETETDFDEIEKLYISRAVTNMGYQFQGGRTSGYYGPYIWTTTEEKRFSVSLPEGTQEYTVQFLDGFLSKSWLDYLSFGEVSTGGWVGEDGMICCVKSSYKMESEIFQVSLLKHEAQHAMDKTQYPGISSAELEYRAKLVELMYSEERDMMTQFLHEADDSREGNGHGVAAKRIVDGLFEKLHKLSNECASGKIRLAAMELFSASSEELRKKYG